ncbi:MAG: 2-phospho-L-lactate transferase [Microbacteriaceae bacterium]|nr:2-phospho-L-lactate transferase [Microbacteriaceae bacterium]
MRITILAGGVGGSKMVEGFYALARERENTGATETKITNTAIVNVSDDWWHLGLKICPDLDSVLYRLAGVSDIERGWGRKDETYRIREELAQFGVGKEWFTLGDLDLSMSIARTSLLSEELSLSEVVEKLSARWLESHTKLLPASDQELPTIVTTELGDMHFQEWWTRYRANIATTAFRQEGIQDATPAPGVLAAIAEADLVVLAPSNPVVSLDPILGIPGIREALRDTSAKVVGVSPLISGWALRGMANTCLEVVGSEQSAVGVAGFLGADILDAFAIHESDQDQAAAIEALGIEAFITDILIPDAVTSSRLAVRLIDKFVG